MLDKCLARGILDKAMKRVGISLVTIFVVLFGSISPLPFAFQAFAQNSVTPNDPLFNRQTYLQQIHAPDAWTLTTGSEKVVIAVIDSGLDIDHPDLKDSVWTNPGEIPGDGIDNDGNGYIDDINGWDFINDIPDPKPKFGGDFLIAGIHHGTLLSGIIAARGNNNLGITGICWRCKVMPLRVLNNQGEGDVFTVVRAIDYAIQKKVDVINLSFVGDTPSSFLEAAIRRATDAGIVVVAASGNDQSEEHGVDLSKNPVYPACYNLSDNVISVGSIDSIGQKALFSNYGPCIDIMAPGADIFSTQVVHYERAGFDTFYGDGWSGTSLSTAIVTGAIALMKSANPSLTPSEIATIIRTTCDPIDSLNPLFPGKLGCGELNTYKLVRAAIDKSKEQNPFQDTPDIHQSLIAISDNTGKVPLTFFDRTGRQVSANMVSFPYTPYHVPYSMSTSSKSGIVVFGAGPGGGPHVRTFDRAGNLISQFFAYDSRFRGGVNVAIGDIDGDGEEDIVVMPASSGGAQVRIFSLAGALKGQFFAYDHKLRGGYHLALGDLNNDGKDEIIVTPSRGVASGDVRVFTQEGVLRMQFFAYANTPLSDISIVVGDTDGDGSEEIITAPGRGKGAVKVFNSFGALKRSFYPYGIAFDGGISLAVGDLDGNRKDDIVTVPRARAPARVTLFDETNRRLGVFLARPEKEQLGYQVQIIP